MIALNRRIFAILICCSPLVLSSEEPQVSAYPQIAWKDLEVPIDFTNAPQIAANEEVDFWESIVYAKDRIVLPVKVKDGKRRLLVWKPGNEAARLDLPSALVTVAYSAADDQIVVWSGDQIYFFDRSSLSKSKEKSAPTSMRGWTESGIRSGEWTLRQGDRFTVYSLESLKVIREFSSPDDAKGSQKAIFLSNGQILLISTYWGAVVRRFSSGDKKSRSESINVSHRSLLRLAQMDDSGFVVFDPLTNTMVCLTASNGAWSVITRGTQIFGDRKAVRFDPLTGTLRSILKVKAKTDTKIRVLLALPPQDTYSQRIRNDHFPEGSLIKYDRFGNRLLEIETSLNAGEERSMELYSATITRYSVSIDLTKFDTRFDHLQPPDLANLYLDDYATYAIHDPAISAKRDELRGSPDDYAQFLKQTQIFSNSIPYKSGRFDAAPVVVKRNNGACTEHTFVTVSILRGGKVPARYVWNYLPVDSHPDLNHKLAEAWLPGFGWIPMEPLAPPGNVAGTTYAHHIIWAAYDKWDSSTLKGGDVLYNIDNAKNLEIAKVEWSLDSAQMTERSLLPASAPLQVNDRVVVP